MEKVKKIKYIVIDVDGTMTDGGVYYDSNGNEIKKFNTRDAAGFFAAHEVGIKTVILTGRECLATTKRMKELQVDFIEQNIRDKKTFLQSFMAKYDLQKEELAYIGDDLNDYEPMKLAGFVGCPNDACEEIRNIADYISVKNGGSGAVRDIIEFMLSDRKEWENAIRNVYGMGI